MQAPNANPSSFPKAPDYYRPSFTSYGTYLNLVDNIHSIRPIILPPYYIPGYYTVINAATTLLQEIGENVLPVSTQILTLNSMTEHIVLPPDLQRLLVWDLEGSTVFPGSDAIPQGCKFYINVAHRQHPYCLANEHYLFTLRNTITNEEMEGDKYDLEEVGTYLTAGHQKFAIVKRTPKRSDPIDPALVIKSEPIVAAITVPADAVANTITELQNMKKTLNNMDKSIDRLLAALYLTIKPE